MPDSVPPAESETATRRPSREGTKKSMVVAPLGSSAFGSTSTFSDFASPRERSVTSSGCCFGGWFLSAKKSPPARCMPYHEGLTRAVSDSICRSTAARIGRASSQARATADCESLHARTAGSFQSSSQR